MPPLLKIKGKRFGRLVAVDPAQTTCRTRWMCLCDCGKQVVTQTNQLMSGKTKSCGCLRKDKMTKHGLQGCTEYWIWHSMKKRCKNRTNDRFNDYGGRGITVCSRWKDFGAFYRDMGKRPSQKHTLERMNNNKGYCPDNCKWATGHEQARNRRNNRWITINGITKCLQDWCDYYGVHSATVWKRERRGIPIDLCFLPTKQL